jgi:hypothetical protein
MEDEIPIRGAGSYVVSLANTYDEVLQKKMDVRGTVTVWLEKDPAVRRTIPLTVLQLAYPVPTGDLLTILPGDSARLLVWWDQRTDGGEPFWSGTRLTEFVTPSGVYLDSEPIKFVAQASIQLFENVQPRTSSPIHYTSMYRLFGSTGGNN